MASDREREEDFVTYGTPLEPLEEDEPIRKPIPVQEQTVKDEKGRYKRFHGAFTGGFSAGYFNTVGSKEGWTPSTFVSSRGQKAERQMASVQDFMDEEDLGEHGIAPQQIVTTNDFASARTDKIRDKARAISSLTAPIPGDTLLEELIAPANSSAGVQMLRKMGWKDGQGVGPRSKRRQRKQHAAKKDGKLHGCALPPSGSEESEDDAEFAPENVTFAPKDVIPVDFTPKDDLHGLGYRGLDPLQALGGQSGAGHIDLFTVHSDRTSGLFGKTRAGRQRQGVIAGQAFGVGAMEDEDADIYHKDAMSNYDVVLGEEEPGDGLFGWTAPQQYSAKKKALKRDVSYVGKILEGFTLASKPAEMKKVFPPPDLPRDYRPVHYFRPPVDPSSVTPLAAQVLQSSRGQLSQGAPQQSRHTLDSAQRREMLGEGSLQGPTSVFDLLNSKDRYRLSAIRKAAEERKASSQSGASQSSADTQPRLSKAQAGDQLQASSATQQALSAWSSPTAQTGQTFRPFQKDPEKQARYDLYISHLKQGKGDVVDSSLDANMTEWERGREREEFMRAAVLYKPSNSSLSSRFTRAKQEDDTDTVEVARDEESDKDDKEAAVKMKMFGRLTRDTFEWHPDKLLCKRFNVPDPYPGSTTVGLPKIKRDKYSVFNFLTVLDKGQSTPTGPTSNSASSVAPAPSASNKRSRWDIAEQEGKVKEPPRVTDAAQVAPVPQQGTSTAVTTVQPKAAETETEPTDKKTEDDDEAEEEEVRPPMDLFKAIFASSSDEKSSSSSEEDSDEEEQQEAEAPENVSVTPGLVRTGFTPPAPVSCQSTPTEPTPIQDQKPQPHTSSTSSEQTRELDREEFGPRLPPPGLMFPSSSSSSPAVQDEKRKKQSKAKHKSKKEHKQRKEKKHKKKSKKHKHKGKEKKKKKKPEVSDTSSNESDPDSDDVVETGKETVSTQDLLQRWRNIHGKK